MTDSVYEVLIKPRQIKNEIKSIDIAIEDLRLMMLPGAIRYDKDSIQSSPADPMDKYIERLSGLEQRRRRLQDEYLDAEERILSITGSLDSTESLIIIMRYIRLSSFDMIAEEIGRSERQMFRYYKTAVKKIEDVIECQ